MTRSETHTLTATAAALLLAGAVRLAVEAARPVPVVEADTTSLSALTERSAAARQDAERRATPLASGERIDVNTALAWELDRLPGVGPSVAEAIVSAREDSGPFRAAEELTRVRGIGSATASRIARHLTFAARTRSGQDPSRVIASRASPGSGREPQDTQADTGSPVDLNRATEAELLRVRGIGPVLAQRIIDMRDQVGRFRRVDDLIDVRGIGPAKLHAIREQLVVRR